MGKFKLLNGVPVRMAANNIMGTVMRRGGATGCEVIVSGKVRGQRAKAQKYTAGYQISTGQPKREFIDIAVRHVELRQGILGLKVKPDQVKILEPKDQDDNITPHVVSSIQQEQQE